MANVVAKTAVNLIDLNKILPLFDAPPLSPLPVSMARLDSKGNRQVCSGSFFYDRKLTTPIYSASRFNGFTQYQGSKIAHAITSFDLKGDDYEAFAKRQDFDGLRQRVFAANDVVTGSDFNDRLCGWGGSNKLRGGKGDDVLRTYVRATDKDTLTGGLGADVFQIYLTDVMPGDGKYKGDVDIIDFSPDSGDKIQFVFKSSAVGAISTSFDARFSGQRGSITFERMGWKERTFDTSTGRGYLRMDANGDKVADVIVRLWGFPGNINTGNLIFGEMS